MVTYPIMSLHSQTMKEKRGREKRPNTTKKDLEPASGTNPSLCDIIYLT